MFGWNPTNGPLDYEGPSEDELVEEDVVRNLFDTLEVYDGCAGQYAGKRTFHQTAEWRTAQRRALGVHSSDTRRNVARVVAMV